MAKIIPALPEGSAEQAPSSGRAAWMAGTTAEAPGIWAMAPGLGTVAGQTSSKPAKKPAMQGFWSPGTICKTSNHSSGVTDGRDLAPAAAFRMPCKLSSVPQSWLHCSRRRLRWPPARPRLKAALRTPKPRAEIPQLGRGVGPSPPALLAWVPAGSAGLT